MSSPRLRIQVERTTPTTWEIRYPGMAAVQPRTVTLVSGGITLPQTTGFDPNNLQDRKLAIDITELKSPRSGDVARFGSYLFDVLVGSAWNTIAAGGLPSAIELASSDPEFHRLPWEMAYGPADFLAKQDIGMVRVIPSANGPQKIAISPTVLFVIGADLSDKRIRPGAEYLGMLKRLQASGLVLDTHLLVRATRKSVEDAVTRIRPSIVVFIAHGGLSVTGNGQLELMSDDGSGKPDYVPASQLRALLKDIPKVVVMNACETGASSRSSVPLAWEIVSKDIPLAIGMTGRVADRACRLFSRRFFESLLNEESVEEATILARREGMIHGSDPQTSVDWAMPALFVLEGLSIEMDKSALSAIGARSTRAESFRKIRNPIVVCGRLDCLLAFHSTLDAATPIGRPKTLALRVTEKGGGKNPPQYGKTRLVEELAALAASWGHLPCVVEKPKATPWLLARQILDSLHNTRRVYGLDESGNYELFRLKRFLEGQLPEAELSESVRNALQFEGVNAGTNPENLPPKVILAALQEDFAALASEARKEQGASPNLRVVVLIDDLHLSDAARAIMTDWVSMYGLGRNAKPEPLIVPFVLTFASFDQEVYRANAEAIRNAAESQTGRIVNIDLKSLPPPTEDDLPYRQYLLSWNPMLVLGTDDEQKKNRFFDGLHRKVQGVPSRLSTTDENDGVMSWVEAGLEFGVLVQADDDQVLKAMSKGK